MKTFQFIQINQRKGLILGGIYLFAVFMLCYFLFGGLIGMADKVNNIGSARGAGLLVGGAVLVPFFILWRWTQPRVSLSVDKGYIHIQQSGQAEHTYAVAAIDKIEINLKAINRLDVYDAQGNLLFYLHPMNRPEILKDVVRELDLKASFRKEARQKKYFNTQVETTTYKRIL